MTQPRIPTPTTSAPTRRQVLRGGAAAAMGIGATATLTACAGGAQNDQPAGPRTLDQQVAVAKSEVPVGGGVIKPEARIVVTQPAADQFQAFSAVCPHQGCLVSLIRDNAIVCACHTSLFAITDGSRISGPAASGLPAVRVTEDGDNLRVG